MPANKLLGQYGRKQLLTAKAEEFKALSGFNFGYRSREDATILSPNVLIPGSFNVLTSVTGTVGNRKGYTLDGAQGIPGEGVTASYDWLTRTGEERNVRLTGGKLQVRTVAADGTVSWVTFFETDSDHMEFAEWRDVAEEKSVLLFVDGSENIHLWTGAVGTVESATATTLTLAGGQTWAESGFLNTGTYTQRVTINGVSYLYSGGAQTDTLTGVSPDPSAVATGSVAIQDVVSRSNNRTAVFDVSFSPVGYGVTEFSIRIVRLETGQSFEYTVPFDDQYGDDLNEAKGFAVSNLVAAMQADADLLEHVNIEYPFALGRSFSVRGKVEGEGFSVLAYVPGGSQPTVVPTGGSPYAENINFSMAGGATTISITVIPSSEGTAYTASVPVSGGINASVAQLVANLQTGGEEGFLAVMEIDYTSGSSFIIRAKDSGYSFTSYPSATFSTQPTTTESRAASQGLPSDFSNDLIAVHEQQVYLGSWKELNVYVSQLNDYTTFTSSSPRLVGDGAILTIEEPPTAFIVHDGDLFIGTRDHWYRIVFETYQTTPGVFEEELQRIRLKSAPLQGPRSQGLTGKLGNAIIYLSNEPALSTLALTEGLDGVPQIEDLSAPVVNDIEAALFAGGHLLEHRKYTYLSAPGSGVFFMLNRTDPENVYWEAPQVAPISRFALIGGELYGHSSRDGETYKLFDGWNDNGKTYKAVAKFAYNSYGVRGRLKTGDAVFVDGYITANGKLVVELEREVGGSTAQFDILGSDQDIVIPYLDDSGLGKQKLGNHPFGSITAAVPERQRLHVYLEHPREPFFEESVAFGSDGKDFSWSVASFSTNASQASEDPTFIRK